MSARVQLASAELMGEAILDVLEPHVVRSCIAGSVRRKVPEVKDIEIVVEPRMVERGFFSLPDPDVEEILSLTHTLGNVVKSGEKYVQVELGELDPPIKLDLFLVTPPAEWGTILAIRTGPARFSTLAVTRIKNRGWRCDQGRILRPDGTTFPTPTERHFFQAAEMSYLNPEDRR